MNRDAIVLEVEPNPPLVPEGIWRAVCLGNRVFNYLGHDKVAFLWRLNAGPFGPDLRAQWERGIYERLFEGFDDPLDALLPAYYYIRREKDRWAAVGQKYAQDLWRLQGKPCRRDRMPTRSLIGVEAFVRVATVVKDSRRLDRQTYSKAAAILKPASATLSIEDIESPEKSVA